MSLIQNKDELTKENSELRRDALAILEAGLKAVDTKKVLRQKVMVESGVLHINGTSFNLQSFNKIIFVGIGKCAFDGAKAIEDILGDKLTAGIALDVKAGELKRIKTFVGTHPYPSEKNILATKEILEMVKGVTERDLVLVLISGGGSALFELPIPGVDLNTIIEATKELTAKGADIYELNKVRKNLSQVKGGKFAEICSPAEVVSLIFSDVLGNDISVIASGPTVLDTPNARVKNILMVSNRDALLAMQQRAKNLGYDTKIESESLSGNATKVGEELARRRLEPKTCFLFGGETTVHKQGDGTGGRNQELALAGLSLVPEGSLLLAAASDGWDNTDTAGAIADKNFYEKSKALGLEVNDFLRRSDSYNFWKGVEGAICTGRLGSNVSDLIIMLSGNGKK